VTAPVAAAFGDFFDRLEEQRHPAQPGEASHHCFGCGPGHPSGLRVRCFNADDGVVSPIVIERRYAGPPGAAHGGIVAAYLDEVLAGAVLRALGRVAVTGELAIRYVRPVPVETALVGRGRVVATTARYVDTEGRLEEFGTDRVLATARGRFFPLEPGV
jgi:uncharacterized protein (TIGR00369 family)